MKNNKETIGLIIIEDEIRSYKRLEKLCLLSFSNYKISIDTASTFKEAEKKLSEKNYDLCFLDLNLNGSDGYNLLKLSNYQAAHTIIVSAYAERAIEAYEYGVLDFIRKPVMEERFKKSIQRFLNSEKKNSCKYLSIKNYGNIERISVNEIVQIKSQGNYSEILTRDNRKELHEKSLAKLEQILPENFLRIHKSFIANKELIKSFHSHGGSQYSLKLESEKLSIELPIGRKYVKEIKSEFES